MYIVENDIRARLKKNDASENQRQKTIRNISKMFRDINEQFTEVKTIFYIKKKHVEWILNHYTHGLQLKPSTLGDYKRDIRRLLMIIDKEHIADLVLEKKDPKKGGRPSKMGVGKTNKRLV